jgi:hypothetical protein
VKCYNLLLTVKNNNNNNNNTNFQRKDKLKMYSNNSYSITQFGKPLSKDKYTIDFESKTLSTIEDNLVLDFKGLDNWTFKTSYGCTFKTGFGCTFRTGSRCTFRTGSRCTFDTGFGCTFKTSYGCTFNTGYGCAFKTGSRCAFKTGSDCTFKTGYECVCVRRDVYDVIEIPENVTIKLNDHEIPGYTIVKETITVELSKESCENLQKAGVEVNLKQQLQ